MKGCKSLNLSTKPQSINKKVNMKVKVQNLNKKIILKKCMKSSECKENLLGEQNRLMKLVKMHQRENKRYKDDSNKIFIKEMLEI